MKMKYLLEFQTIFMFYSVFGQEDPDQYPDYVREPPVEPGEGGGPYEAENTESVQEYKGRPIPPELEPFFSTNADYQYADNLRDCMKDFSSCLYVKGQVPFCGLNKQNGQKKLYPNLCEMNYENCRLGSAVWMFVDEKNCDGSLNNVKDIQLKGFANQNSQSTNVSLHNILRKKLMTENKLKTVA